MKDINFTKSLGFIKGTKLQSTRSTVASLQSLQSVLKQLKDSGANKNQIGKVRYEAMQAIQADLIQNNNLEIENLNNQIGILKDAWDRDYDKNYSKHSRTIDEARRRYQAMTQKQLENESVKVMNNPNKADMLPAVLDELSISLKQSNSPQYSIFREAITNNKLDLPYLHTDIAKEIYGDMELLSNSKTNILIKDDTGRRQMMDLESIDGFLASENPEGPEDNTIYAN